MSDSLMNPYYYLVPGIAGTILLILSVALSVYLLRFEPFVPLLFAGRCLISLMEFGIQLRLKKSQVFQRAERLVRYSTRFFVAGLLWNISLAVIATLLQTGFSLYYAFSILVGAVIWLLGTQVSTIGLVLARKKPAEDANNDLLVQSTAENRLNTVRLSELNLCKSKEHRLTCSLLLERRF